MATELVSGGINDILTLSPARSATTVRSPESPSASDGRRALEDALEAQVHSLFLGELGKQCQPQGLQLEVSTELGTGLEVCSEYHRNYVGQSSNLIRKHLPGGVRGEGKWLIGSLTVGNLALKDSVSPSVPRGRIGPRSPRSCTIFLV